MRAALIAAIATLLAFSVSCDEGDTFIQSSDCGLVRSDLLGTWNVTVPAASTYLFNCSDPFFNDKDVIISASTTWSYDDMEVFASSSNVGFFFSNSTRPEEIFGNVETDSCGMLFSFLVTASALDPTPLYLQCIGTLDRPSGTVNAFCDSATVLGSPLADPVTVLSDCDLSLILESVIAIQ